MPGGWAKHKNHRNKLPAADRRVQLAKAEARADDAAARAPARASADETWATLAARIGLDNRLTKAIAKAGWVRPTLVQAEMLPQHLL